MADNLDDLLAVATPDPVARKQRPHGDGWTPSVRGDDTGGEVVTPPRPEGADRSYDDLMRDCGIDPDVFEVIEPVLYNRWMQRPGEWLTQDKFKYQRRGGAAGADVEALCRQIAGHRYRRPAENQQVSTATALVVALSDWQTGPDPEGLVSGLLAVADKVTDRLKQAKPDCLYVVGLGDMVEGCDGHYAQQTWATAAGGLNGYRDQEKLARRMLVKMLTGWARHVPKMVVGAVPGNHGERRKGGKAFTTFEDNADLAVFEQAAEIMGANPDAYGHVRFVLPDGDMSLTLDVVGTVVSFIHGHQARRGGATAQQKVEAWWKGKEHAQHPVGDASVLVNGHFHTFAMAVDGPRTWMQAPAMAQSRWWEESGGCATATGTLTFQVGPDGWHSVEVLDG